MSAGAAAGTTSFQIVASSGAASAAQGFTLTIATAAPAITSGASAQFTLTAGVGGTLTLTSTGVPTPNLTEAGVLPSGVNLISNSNGTATLLVAPGTTPGTTTFTLVASNSAGPPATQTFTLTVN